MPTLAESILVSVVSGAVSSVITVSLSLARFRREKWWERKVIAYERVIEALYHHKAFSLIDLSVSEGNRPKEELEQFSQRADEARHEIDKAIHIGAFMLSDQAQARVWHYRHALLEAEKREHDEGFRYNEADLEATQSCLDDLIQLAKADLHTSGRNLPF